MSSTRSRPCLSGFTMIEAIMVISLVILLTSITVPGAVSALRVGRVNQAVSMVDTANSDAQRFARASDGIGAGGEYYGVRLSGGQPPHSVSVIYGVPGSADPIEGLEKSLNPGILFYDGDAPLSGDVEWYYAYGNGFPVTAGAPTGPNIAIGVTGSPIIEALSVRSNDGIATIRMSIFEIGLFHREEF